MQNWSTDEQAIKNMSPDARNIWRLEQLINFGLQGEKLSVPLVRKYWSKLSIDPARRAFLNLFLHEH